MKLFRSVDIFGSLVLAVLTGCSNAAREASKNDAPVAQQVMFVTANPARVGAVLQGSYQYSDPDGDGEKDTLKAWLRDGQPIDGANQNEYIASAQDSGKNLQFQVTPAAASGTSPGAAVASTGITIENSAPVVTLAPLVGAASLFTTGVGSELRVDFSYNDVDGDTAASAEIRWLRYLSPTSIVPIPDATTPRYKVTLEDLSYPLVAEVTPRALAGVLRGATVISASILIVNSVPVAQNVELKASAMPVIVGTDLTASYSYFDADNDAVASGSAIQWLRNGVILDGVTTPTYTLTSADAGASFQFTVTPKASLGLSPGVSVTSNTLTAVNSAPQASKVVVNGGATSTAVDMPLSASYTYGDLDLNSEGASVYRWYRGANIITGATTLSYIVVAADSGADLSFEVTPVATLGTSPGNSARSNIIRVNNSAPLAKNVMLSANTTSPDVGTLLTASYTYSDADGDAQGTSTFRWLRNGSAITGAVGTRYTLVSADAPTATIPTITITFEVTPIAATGDVLIGNATLSNSIAVANSAPTVTTVAITPGTARVNRSLMPTVTPTATRKELVFTNGATAERVLSASRKPTPSPPPMRIKPSR